jgi:hypothetical protein
MPFGRDLLPAMRARMPGGQEAAMIGSTFRFLRFMAGIALLTAAVLWFLGGGWRILGLGDAGGGARTMARQARMEEASAPRRQAALEAALAPMGVKVSHFVPSGDAFQVVISWPLGNPDFGSQALRRVQERGVIRAFRANDSHFLDVRDDSGQRKYIGRFQVTY